MTGPLLLGIDIGTTNIKAAVFDRSGQAVALASRSMPVHYPRPGWAYHRPAEVWTETVAVIRDALSSLEPHQVQAIAGLAVASMGECGVPLDARGEPTYDAIAWFDTRTQAQLDHLAATVGAATLFGITGLALNPFWSLCKVLWLREHEPDAFNRTVRWLHVADYVARRLGGHDATDHSLASRTMAYDIRGRRWSDDLLAEVNVPATLWAPLVESGTALGRLGPEPAAETGLPTSAVIAAGGHDHLVGALAAGAVEPGQVLNSLGTAEALLLPLERPIADPAMGKEGYTQGAHVVPGRLYALGGQHTAAAALDWVRDVLGGDHPELIAAAETVPPGSLGAAFLPYLRLAAPGTGDTRVRGAWVGLSTDTDRGALYRAALEGLAFESRSSLQRLLEHAGISMPPHVVAIGGLTRNDLLMRIKASTLGRPFAVSSVRESTALGAALLAGLGAGVYRDLPDALAALDRTRVRVDPVADDVARYNTIYEEVYRRLYPTLRDLNHTIYRHQRPAG